MNEESSLGPLNVRNTKSFSLFVKAPKIQDDMIKTTTSVFWKEAAGKDKKYAIIRFTSLERRKKNFKDIKSTMGKPCKGVLDVRDTRIWKREKRLSSSFYALFGKMPAYVSCISLARHEKDNAKWKIYSKNALQTTQLKTGSISPEQIDKKKWMKIVYRIHRQNRRHNQIHH